MTTRWQRSAVPRGADYDARWRSLADSGQNIHGEADLVERLLSETGGHGGHGGPGGHSVLDAGCGTGRVAIELARRGFTVTGIDADPDMLATARANAPQLTWIEADVSGPSDGTDGTPVDLVVLAGNVMIFLEPGTEAAALTNLAARLTPGGLLVAGFSLQSGRLALHDYDAFAAAAGLVPVARWATWDRQPFDGGDYAVSVHRAQ